MAYGFGGFNQRPLCSVAFGSVVKQNFMARAYNGGKCLHHCVLEQEEGS